MKTKWKADKLFCNDGNYAKPDIHWVQVYFEQINLTGFASYQSCAKRYKYVLQQHIVLLYLTKTRH